MAEEYIGRRILPTPTRLVRRGKCIVSGISAECCWIRFSKRGGGHEETDKGSHVLGDGLVDIIWSSETCRLLWETKAGRKGGWCPGEGSGSSTPTWCCRRPEAHRRWSGSSNRRMKWCLLFNEDICGWVFVCKSMWEVLVSLLGAKVWCVIVYK